MAEAPPSRVGVFSAGDTFSKDALSAISQACSSAAKGTVAVSKGTAALTSTALASTRQATTHVARESLAMTRKAGESTYHATGSLASTTRAYSSKVQKSLANAISLAEAGGAEGAETQERTAESGDQSAPPTPAARTAAERQQDVRADHRTFDTTTQEGRAALLHEAVAAINANASLRLQLRVGDQERGCARDVAVRRALRGYQTLATQYEDNILSAVQAGAEGQERLRMAVLASRDMEARLRHFSVSAAELKTRVETLRGLTRPLELAEANIHAGQSKVAHLSELVGHIKALRVLEPPYMLQAPYARPPADRASYFTAAAPLLQQCCFHWAALTSFTPAPAPGVPPAGGTAASGSAAQKLSGPPPHPIIVEDPVQTAKIRAAEAKFAGHPRLIRVRQALANLSDAVIAHCRAEFQAAIDVLRHQPLETQALSRVAANCHAPVFGPMI